jgi:hypothetical protein
LLGAVLPGFGVGNSGRGLPQFKTCRA